MELAKYIKSLREKRGLTQRQLAQLSNISNTEISRIENGSRKNPSPETLKKLAPHLGVPYQELMKVAGYIEEIVDHDGYLEYVFTDDSGELVDIYKQIKVLHRKDIGVNWAKTAYRAANTLNRDDMEKLDEYANLLIQKYIKEKRTESGE